MGAVALSTNDVVVLESLKKMLRLPSKAQVIHRALEELRRVVERECLAGEIKQSVQKCHKADFEEHRALTGAAFSRMENE